MIKHMDKVKDGFTAIFVGAIYLASMFTGIWLMISVLRGCGS